MSKVIISIIVLIIGLGGGVALERNFINKAKPALENATNEKKIKYWVAPMDANYRRDRPGKSPMGMALVPVYMDDMNDEDDDNAVRISSAVINNLGVRTAAVTQGPFQSRIETVGYINYDENKISHIHLRANGWVEKLYISSEGERVQKGDALFDIYSPELVNAQSDYLNALKTGRSGLIKASKERLRSLAIPKSTITRITKTRKVSQFIKIYAPQNGIVAEINIVEGMYVTPQTTILSLADLSSVWLLTEVFEKQSRLIEDGLTGNMRLSHAPEKIWSGNIAYIYPEINQQTRTLKVRLKFDNPDENLKPGMYANVTILGKEKPNTVMIPREALIRTGNSERVILALGEGRFQPVKVISGLESGEKIEIISGLKAGEKIVTSAQFLIDSEASFTGTALRMGYEE